MPAITIARSTTEDQKIASNSLPAQEKRMLDYCQRKTLKVSNIKEQLKKLKN